MKALSRLSAGLAAAVLLATTTVPALADETLTQSSTQSTSGSLINATGADDENSITKSAFSNASGNIGVSQAAGDGNLQGNMLYIDGGSNFAFTGTFSQSGSSDHVVADQSPGPSVDRNSLDIDAFRNAQGRIGVNQAAGEGNKQLNAAVIADASGKTLSTSIQQSVVASSSTEYATHDENFIVDNAFRRASGDIGVNQAAGELNQQTNTLVVADDSALTVSAQALSQSSTGNTYTSSTKVFPPIGTSVVGGNAFQNATGNVGVNQGAGAGNMQTNTAAVLK